LYKKVYIFFVCRILFNVLRVASWTGDWTSARNYRQILYKMAALRDHKRERERVCVYKRAGTSTRMRAYLRERTVSVALFLGVRAMLRQLHLSVCVCACVCIS